MYIKPLVSIAWHNDGTGAHTICRDCGTLTPLTECPSLAQGALLRDRHLAQHLSALAAEMAEAAR